MMLLKILCMHTFLTSFSKIFFLLFKQCQCKLKGWLKLHIGLFSNIPTKIFIMIMYLRSYWAVITQIASDCCGS